MRQVFVIILVLTQLTACASRQSSAQSPTAGLELSMYVRDGTGAEALYVVEKDGTIGFGGGFKARMNSTTWQGQLTADEITQLRSLLEERHWFRSSPASTAEPPKFMYRVKLRAPEARRSFTVDGKSPELEPIRALLAAASARRLEDDLRRLPQPSSQR